jgi:CRP-like cAMP-binding protein
MNKHTNNRLEFIKKHPIFDNLSTGTIENILALSSFFNIKKNSKLFFKDEEVKYFYIIVKGSAILFENTSDGNQNILQFVKNKEIIGDVFSKNYIYSAASNEESLIMLIPIKLIRSLVNDNPIFCLNLLKEFSARNKKIFNFLTRLKVNNAKQRVIQFILLLEAENPNESMEITLNFSKTIIASYLNVKPETFSRILRKLKNDGEISIKKNSITLLKKDCLVRYINKQN